MVNVILKKNDLVDYLGVLNDSWPVNRELHNISSKTFRYLGVYQSFIDKQINNNEIVRLNVRFFDVDNLKNNNNWLNAGTSLSTIQELTSDCINYVNLESFLGTINDSVNKVIDNERIPKETYFDDLLNFFNTYEKRKFERKINQNTVNYHNQELIQEVFTDDDLMSSDSLISKVSDSLDELISKVSSGEVGGFIDSREDKLTYYINLNALSNYLKYDNEVSAAKLIINSLKSNSPLRLGMPSNYQEIENNQNVPYARFAKVYFNKISNENFNNILKKIIEDGNQIINIEREGNPDSSKGFFEFRVS